MVVVQENTVLITDAMLSGNRMDQSTNAMVTPADIQKTMGSKGRAEIGERVMGQPPEMVCLIVESLPLHCRQSGVCFLKLSVAI
jgi:hypothetical protein